MKDPDHLRKCNCKSKCDRVEYFARISSFKFPSKVLQTYWPEGELEVFLSYNEL